MGLGVPRAGPVPAARDSACTSRPRAGPVGRAAAGRRRSASAGRRASARRSSRSSRSRSTAARPAAARCSPSRSASGSACRSCSSRSASSGRSAGALGFLRRHRLAIMRVGGAMLVAPRARPGHRACGATWSPWLQGSSSAATRSCRWCERERATGPRASTTTSPSGADRGARRRRAADAAARSASSAGCAGRGASSRACASRSCCSCSWPSPPCRARSCRSARRTRPRSRRTSPTTRRSARGSTGSGSSTCTRRSGSPRSTCCCSSRSSAASCRAPRVHLAGAARPPAARTPPVRRGSPRRASAASTHAPAQVADDAAAVLRGGWRWLPFVPTYRVDTRDEGGGTGPCPPSAATCARPATSSSTSRSSGCSSPWRPGSCCTTAGRRSSSRAAGSPTPQVDYDTFEQGTAFDPSSLVPFTLRLDEFESRFDPDTLQSRDFTAHVTAHRTRARSRAAETIKVNHPLDGRRRQGLPAGQRVRARRHRARRRRRGRLRRPDAVPAAGRGLHLARRHQGARRVRRPGADRPRRLPAADRAAGHGDGPSTRSIDPQPDDPAARARGLAGQPRPRHRGAAERLRARRGADDAGCSTTTATPVTLVVRPGRDRRPARRARAPSPSTALPRFVALDLRHDPALRVRARVRARSRSPGSPPRCSRRAGASGCAARPGRRRGRRSYSGHRGRAGARRRRRPPARARPGARSDARPHRRQTPGRSPRPDLRRGHAMTTGDLSTLLVWGAATAFTDRAASRSASDLARIARPARSGASREAAARRVRRRARAPATAVAGSEAQSAPGRSVRGPRASPGRPRCSASSCCFAGIVLRGIAAGRVADRQHVRVHARRRVRRRPRARRRAAPPRSSRSSASSSWASACSRSSSRSTCSTSRPTQVQPALQSYWLVIHVGVAIIATGIFTVAFAAARAPGAPGAPRGGRSRRRRAPLGSRPAACAAPTVPLAGQRAGGSAGCEQVPGSRELEALSFRLNAIGFVLWTFTLIGGRHLGRARLGPVLGLGPQGGRHASSRGSSTRPTCTPAPRAAGAGGARRTSCSSATPS